MVHADNQYDPGLVAEMAAPILAGEADIVIGSRLLDDRAIAGGMPRWKWVGNRLLTGIENRAFGVRFSEYHTGYRAFSADFLRSIPFLRNSDDFVFDQEIFAQMLARGARVRRDPDPDALLPRGVERRLRDEPALRAARRCGCSRASGSTAAALALLRRRAALDRPARERDAPAHRTRRLVAALAGRRALVLRLAYVAPRRTTRSSTTRSTTTATRSRSPPGTGSRSPTGARPRSARPATRSSSARVYHVVKADRKPVEGARAVGADRQRVRRDGDRRADRGDRVPAVGPARGAGGDGARRGLHPADPRRAVGDVRAAVRALPARVDGGGSGAPALAARYRWAMLAGVLIGLAILGRAQRDRSCSCRWPSPCGTAVRGARAPRSGRRSCCSSPRR